MDAANLNPGKEELLKSNKVYRELSNTHQQYEQRLSELAKLHYPNEGEILEETELKKKKLAVKDEIQTIMNSTNEKSSRH